YCYHPHDLHSFPTRRSSDLFGLQWRISRRLIHCDRRFFGRKANNGGKVSARLALLDYDITRGREKLATKFCYFRAHQRTIVLEVLRKVLHVKLHEDKHGLCHW